MQIRPRINKETHDKVKLNGLTFNDSLNFRLAHDELMIRLREKNIDGLRDASKILLETNKRMFIKCCVSLTLSIFLGLFIAGDKLGLFELIGGLINGN